MGIRRQIGFSAVLCAAVAPAASSQLQQAAPLSISREMRIDGTRDNLATVPWVQVFSDGSLAMGQLEDRNVLFYSPSGTRLGAFGRAGAGPGEFGWLSMAGMAGDTLWVRDNQNSRITMVTRERALASIINIVAANPKPGQLNQYPEYPYILPVGVAANGPVFLSAMTMKGSMLPVGFDASDAAIISVNRKMEIERIVARQPRGTESSVTIRTPDGGSASLSIPFGNTLHSDWAADASRVVFAEADIDGPNDGTIGVVAIASSGDTLFSRRYSFVKEPIPASVRDSAFAEESRMQSGNRLERDLLRELERRGLPRVYPPLSTIVAGRDGSVWLGMRRSGAERPWVALDPSGNIAGWVTLPATTSVMEASLSSLWVVERDSNDVESVSRYAVRR